MRSELESALSAARTLPCEQLPELLGALEEIRATALVRLVSPSGQRTPDELLDIDQAAQRLGVSKDYLYRNHQRFPFARRMGRKLLFSSVALDDYLRKRK